MKNADHIRALIPSRKLPEAEEVKIGIGYCIALDRGNYIHPEILSDETQEFYRQKGFTISEDKKQIFVILYPSVDLAISVPEVLPTANGQIMANIEWQAKAGYKAYTPYPEVHPETARQFREYGFKVTKEGNHTTFEW